MRTVLSLLFFLLISVNNYAQTAGKGKISGKVTDAVTKQPVDYATISVFKQGAASPFNGISTDAKGVFSIDNIPAGDYKVTIDFLGYKRTTIDHVTVTDGGNTPALSAILLQPVQNQLAGVTITAKTPIIENRIDKMVYNAANDLTAQGGVALDVLKKVPQVSVDIDGNVELQGNANVRFLINGKPSSIFGASLADALQAIPASQIKSIEVITSPGAKYDAAGTGGIINIILKDSKVQGINGSVNLSAGSRLENGSFNLNARKNNFGVNAFFSGNAQLKTTGLSSNNRTSSDLAEGTQTNLTQSGDNTQRRSGYQSGLSFNWSVTPKDELTASVGFNHFGNHNNGFSAQEELKATTAGAQLYDLLSNRTSDSRFHVNATDVSLSYKKQFKTEGQELEVQYNTSYGKNTFSYFNEQDYLTGGYPTSGSRSNNPGSDRETNISIDYTQPFSKTFTLEGGVKAVLQNLKNVVNTDTLLNDGTYINNAGQTYGFNYKRKIYAGYLSVSTSLFHKFLDAKIGLRDEYTNTTADFPGVTIPGYNTVVPSATLAHKLTQTSSIKLAYSYRIERPDYGDLNPFYNISDPHNISTGNPNLKPELSHGLELGYNKSYDGGANFYLGSFYRHNLDDIQQFTTPYPVLNINGRDYADVLLNQRSNIGTQTTVGGNLFGSVPIGKLNLRTNMFFASRTNTNPGTVANPGVIKVTGFGYRINLNASYQFPHDLTAEAFANYNSSQKNLQGSRPYFFFYNFAVRKQFLNKKASLGLVAANPFTHYITQKSTTYGSTFNQLSIRQVPLQSFGISLSYKFGKLEFSKDKEKDKEDNNMPAQDAGGR
ncbi:TonB-dependent receptor domain-containing protein [Mucilaginibacter gilvus]|uniref:TonB-dependent receptor n=1 Tax=Mucilaginibacter gilvus TaxID=2305909 RepID=A0A3S3WF46_9SPHI|nr:TonB-dependent receptor [Mucilaginibacter gilvus]RWY55519.1 TonB-dependent receptor [Mucilaginibacter gilvus]